MRSRGEQAASTPPLESLRRQQGVHGACPKTLQIESHELESQGFENARERGCHGRIKRTIHLFPRDLNPHDFSVMRDAKLPEAEGAESIFPLFDGTQRLARYRTPVLDP